MAAPIVPQPFQPGFRLIDGSALNTSLAQQQGSTQYNAVANGTSAATGTQITVLFTHFGTVASGGYAVLPPAAAGNVAYVFNYGANTLNIAPAESTTVIDGGSAGAATTLTVAHRGAQFYCLAPGVWISDLIGAISS